MLIQYLKKKVGVEIKPAFVGGKIRSLYYHNISHQYRSFAIAVGILSLGVTCYSCVQVQNIKNASSTHGHDYLNADTIPIIQMSELNKHNKEDDCWVSIHGHVYDVTEFLENHPGGKDKLLRFAGKDATRGFKLQHPQTYLETFLDDKIYRGELLVVKDEKEKKEKRKFKSEDENVDVHEKFEKTTVTADTDLDELKNKDITTYYKTVADQYLKKLDKKKTKKARKKKKIKLEDTVEVKFTDEHKPELSQIFSLNDFEYIAKKVMPELVYSFIQSGTDNEISRYEERAALGRIFFRPKCLVDVTNIDLSNKYLGIKSKMPFLIGPLTGSGLVQNEGENLVIRSGVVDKNVTMIIPKDSDSGLDDLMMESRGKEIFYQYSIDSKEELENSVSLLNDLTTKYPNIKGIFINVNHSYSGNLEHYKKIEASRHLTKYSPAPELHLKTESEFKLCWNDLVKIKNSVKVPVVLRGIQRSEDILKCQELGFKGISISNYDGKTMDQTQSSIEILYDSKDKLKDPNFDIFVENNFRRGSDIVKALCLGGKPIITKPILFSELYGEEGVKRSIDILTKEVITTMKLIGAKSVNELNEDFIDCESLKFKSTISLNLDRVYDDNYSNIPPPLFSNQEKLRMI